MEQKELRELVQLEDTLKAQLTQLKLQLNTLQSAAAKKELKKAIETLEKRIEKLASKIQSNVKSNTTWLEVTNLLTSIKGFGFGSACRLLAYLPDIKFFESAKQLAAFIGVSPSTKRVWEIQG